ncbi:5-guanidino-2-oxopentanoate decarboxylase [Marinobacterium arenosum]|uniref:5-guanidino-2-oxopentanoate decarboxylase n=1 Tax=Marinobacterium arenosum TaxID=2862496 RepID=UPI001C94353A|nr:5-guanidino-2-oxopentanoate decarboxylase [Marinobacterium arenosum]MBY4677507.1 5-guanidino-2-oxopentanoate decarboxylase [Marinobacterium arenosum]
MITCGEVLVELLEAYGVDTVFGIPGVHTVELYRGLPATAIRHQTPRHEQGAGFMADGYARVTGKPGVCFIITGPGMTNIATAMGQAYADSIPMLVISSVNNRAELGMGAGRLHELPGQRQLIAGVTAFSHTLMRPDELPAVLARAFAVFNSARPRPVHIEIPLDVITAPADHLSRKPAALPSRPGPAPAAIAQAATMLQQARNPVVLLGGGSADAAEPARQLVEALDAPTLLTINAKGVLPPGHPLSLGSNQSLQPVRELVKAADLVLAIGTELGETDYDVVFDGGFGIQGQLIRIDIDAEQLNRNFPADLAILSDARLAMDALLESLAQSTTADRASGRARVTAVQAQLDRQWPTAWSAQRQVLQTVQQALPGVIIAGDSTQPVYSGNHLYEAAEPRRWFNSSTGYGTLGYGLPAAIGAKLAAPERPVVALIGDGGIQFTLPELASAVEAGAPVIVLLWNNSGYGEIKHYMERREIPTIGVDIYTPDFQTIARGFGCHAEQADSFEQLHTLLQAAAKADRPTLIEVREDADFIAGQAR